MTEREKTDKLERLAALVCRVVEDADALVDDLISNRCEFSHRVSELVSRMECAGDADTFEQLYLEAHGLAVDLLRDVQERRTPGSVVEVKLAFMPVQWSEN